MELLIYLRVTSGGLSFLA